MTHLIQLPQLLLSTHRPQHLSSSDLPHNTSPSYHIRTVSTLVSPFASRYSTRSPAICVLVTQSTRYCPYLISRLAHVGETKNKVNPRTQTTPPHKLICTLIEPTSAERDRYRTPNGGSSLLPVLPGAITWRCAPPGIWVDVAAALRTRGPESRQHGHNSCLSGYRRCVSSFSLPLQLRTDNSSSDPPPTSLLFIKRVFPCLLPSCTPSFLLLSGFSWTSPHLRPSERSSASGMADLLHLRALSFPTSPFRADASHRRDIPSFLALLPDLCPPTTVRVLNPRVFLPLISVPSLPSLCSALNAWMLFWFHTRCLLRGFADLGREIPSDPCLKLLLLAGPV
ncbi:hypothetical protein B0H13DRAFT_2340733 [Mycena leptocephala]|nr:hypothetical protein B0H13DRAFT_2340733 [Mycena leptocephala]